MAEPLVNDYSPVLSWLPPSADWNDRFRLLGETAEEDTWRALVGLANSRLDSLATMRLDRRRGKLFPAAPSTGLSAKPLRLAVLSSSTADHLLASLRVGALRRNMWADVHVGDYGQYRREIMDPSSGLHQFKPTAVLFAFDAPHLLGGLNADAPDLDAIADDIAQLWDQVRAAFGCSVIQQSILGTYPSQFGSNEHRLPNSKSHLVRKLNLLLRERADAGGVDMLDLDPWVARDGMRAWYDPMLWLKAKQEVHHIAAPLYGDLVARLLAAQLGRSFKCLVLDLDNTLWGGVIGDDGLEGIVLGQGSPRGEAHIAFQQYAQSLTRRGIILAVCSKNDMANALEPFEKHPEMVLKRDDIACFVANWQDKAGNLRSIAQQLNIGTDALVFADDNPAEREIVRQNLPEVAVPELPEDPGLYAACVAEGGYFEGLRLTDEDLERARQYQDNLKRETLKASATDIEGYLRSLEMQMRWRPFDKVGLARIVQLINKTNQFNLTTRRITDEAAGALIGDPRALTLQIRLVDRFGDNGIIAIVTGKLDDAGDLTIDTWLMSCRVLGRQAEEATLNLIVAEARRMGARRLIGDYIPTAKNGMVKEHYPRLGFAPLGDNAEGGTRWELPLDGAEAKPTFITLTQE